MSPSTESPLSGSFNVKRKGTPFLKESLIRKRAQKMIWSPFIISGIRDHQTCSLKRSISCIQIQRQWSCVKDQIVFHRSLVLEVYRGWDLFRLRMSIQGLILILVDIGFNLLWIYREQVETLRKWTSLNEQYYSWSPIHMYHLFINTIYSCHCHIIWVSIIYLQVRNQQYSHNIHMYNTSVLISSSTSNTVQRFL